MCLIASLSASVRPVPRRPATPVQALRRGVVLHGINFLCDDSWAALHLGWIGAGPVALIPQAVLLSWDLYLGLRGAAAWTGAELRGAWVRGMCV
jgi:hypothetical protein